MSNFTCADGQPLSGTTMKTTTELEGGATGASSCFRGCNYVNEYDVCWNAAPTTRKFSSDMFGLPGWSCGNTEGFNNMDSCNPYSTQSCFGECDINATNTQGKPIPNCGTITWFNAPLGLNPAEVALKAGNRPAINNYPYWQNYYSNVNTNSNVYSVNLPGLGTITNPIGATSIAADQTYCGVNGTGIKPYNLTINTPSGCEITQTTAFNNQGIIAGTVGIN